jgi:hypothetical protein
VGQLINVVAGLATTLIGYIVGRTWQKLVDRIPYRRAKIFWQPLFNAEIQIVVSRFESPSFPEPTGLVGGGDALALREISSYFSRIGFRRHKVVYVDEPALDRKNNLILLGGPDANAVTKDALELIEPRLRLIDPGPGIPVEIHDLAPAARQGDGDLADAISEQKYVPKADSDYGIIIRARNPFNPGRGLVIFAGAYGYGTWGGVNLVLTDDNFLRRCQELETEYGNAIHRRRWNFARRLSSRDSGSPGNRLDNESVQLECIFKVGVYDRRPYAHEIIALRPLPPKPLNAA